jgi:serine O-acetyltransferase
MAAGPRGDIYLIGKDTGNIMEQSLNKAELNKYVAKQIENFFPDSKINSKRLMPFINRTIARTEHCFSKIKSKYFFDGNHVRFNHLNTDQYAIFLYFLSNTIWREEKDEDLASRAYYLNKALNGLDVFYQVSLPDIFLLVHPLGTVLGRGEYKDYFVAYQRVTVGGNKNLDYPRLGKGVAMYNGSALIGKCTIGDNTLISANTTIMDKNIPANVVAYNRNAAILCKPAKKSVVERYFE